jgi:hypothetical protein
MLSLISDIYPEKGLLRRDKFKAKHVAIEIGKSDLVWISILIIIIIIKKVALFCYQNICNKCYLHIYDVAKVILTHGRTDKFYKIR